MLWMRVGDFLVDGWTSRRVADFIGNHGDPSPCSPARPLRWRVESEQVGLFGESSRLDDLPMSRRDGRGCDDFGGRLDGLVWCGLKAVGGLLHGLMPVTTPRESGCDIEQDLGGIGDALNGSDHLVDGRGVLRRWKPDLRVLHDVLHVDAHSCMVLVTSSMAEGLDADLGGLIRGASDLSGTSRNLAG